MVPVPHPVPRSTIRSQHAPETPALRVHSSIKHALRKQARILLLHAPLPLITLPPCPRGEDMSHEGRQDRSVSGDGGTRT